MPIPNQAIGSTSAKSGTFQYDTHRIQGIPLKIPVAAGVTSIPNTRIVSIQTDANNVMYAVVSPVALANHTIIGWGVLEEALQSSGISSIAPTPNTFVNGDTVTVLRYPMEVFAIDYDASNKPSLGIGTGYIDVQGRLSSVSTGDNRAVKGSIFESVPGRQMAGQLKTGCVYFQMYSPVDP